jgi:nitrogen fixation-related uncharacterized protein
MTLLYLSIPFMVVGVAIAVVPLLWAMGHQQQWEDDASETCELRYAFAQWGDGAPKFPDLQRDLPPVLAVANNPEIEIGEALLVGSGTRQ